VIGGVVNVNEPGMNLILARPVGILRLVPKTKPTKGQEGFTELDPIVVPDLMLIFRL